MEMHWLAVLGVAVLAGCATKPSRESVEKDLIKAEERRAEQLERSMKKRNKQLGEALDEEPAWAVAEPRPDASGVYAVGRGESSSLQMAIRKARMEAEFGVAKMMRQEVSGSERMVITDRGGAVNQQTTVLIDKLVARVPVVGYEVVKSELKPMNGRYASWILLKMPYEAFEKALADQRAETEDANVKAQFDELERRIAARRAEEAERRKEHLEELDRRAAMLDRAAGEPRAIVPGSKGGRDVDPVLDFMNKAIQ